MNRTRTHIAERAVTALESPSGPHRKPRWTKWARSACIWITACLCLPSDVAAAVPVPPSGVVPHGCASISSDYSVSTEPVFRRVVIKMHSNEPCTFIYAEGDTFSGAGRFTVTCESGGRFHHPDVYPDGSRTFPLFEPIPQPCRPGDVVTLNGYHQLSGGLVIGGGFSPAPPTPRPRLSESDLRSLCAPGSEPSATVDMLEPVNYSGILTYRGTVRCDGADIKITSLTVTPLAGYPFPSAGAARCKNCKEDLSVTGTAPAKMWIYDVEMTFEVAPRVGPVVTGTRVGRYAVSWAGNVTTLCPGVRLWTPSSEAPANPYVEGWETCPI